MRTTLKSTVSSVYGFNDDWHSLGTQLDQIYGWEAPYTAVLYTLLHVRARTKVGSEVQRAPSGAKSLVSPMAQPPVLLPSAPPMRAGRPALPLPWASKLPLGPRGGRYCERRLPRQSVRRCSRIEQRFSPPMPPNAASLATTSVVVMVGDVCAVSGSQTASFAIDIDLWRSSQKRYQHACERGSAEAMRAGKERGQVC